MSPGEIVARVLGLLVEIFGRALVRGAVDEWTVADEVVRAEWQRRYPGTEPP